MPRHSPCALVRLNFLLYFSFIACSRFFELLEFHKTNNFFRLLLNSSVKRFYPFAFWISSTFRWNCIFTQIGKTLMILTWLISKSKSLLSSYLFVSYSSIYFIRFSMNILDFARSIGTHKPFFGCRHCRLVGSSGLEPPTSRLSGARSNHLSYEPI